MNRKHIATLPHPISSALQSFLDEDLARSADEISELFVAVVEYVGAVALADYLDGHADPEQCAKNPSLNGWLVSQLATGKAEAGHWARWTQIAVQATISPVIPCLKRHVQEANLDDPTQDLSWMLRFRNDVMHGGFVAPLSKIKQAITRMERIFERLAPLFALKPLGCSAAEPEAIWHQLNGLATSVHEAPSIDRDNWQGTGSVVLVDENHRAVLAIHPGCEIDPDGWMHLQHAWRTHHQILFHRPAIRVFFDSYQKERMGEIDDTLWREAVQRNLPTEGYRSRSKLEERLQQYLSRSGAIIRLVGPVGSGKSTLALRLPSYTDRPTYTLHIEPASVRMDPGVVRRWCTYILSQHFIQKEPPKELSKSRPNKKDKIVIQEWSAQMKQATKEMVSPILVIDDSDLMATGLYQEIKTQGCFDEARRYGASILLIHRPSGTPPSNGDQEIRVLPWGKDEISLWGANHTELILRTGGHVGLLADPNVGMRSLCDQLQRNEKENPLGARGLDILCSGPASMIEVADAMDEFTPEVELAFRKQLDFLVASERAATEPDGSPTRVYALYPAINIALNQRGKE